MNAATERKIVTRIEKAWPLSGYSPVRVQEEDTRHWQVTYVEKETGECITVPLRKRDLRAQEQSQMSRLLLGLAFPGTVPFAGSRERDSSEVHQFVRASISDQTVSQVKVLGAFLDTLEVNVMPTDSHFQPEKRQVDQELQQELTRLKERAQEEEKPIQTRFVFDGVALQMTAKGREGFQWILRSPKLSLAVNRSSKMALLAKVRCSSEYLWSVRDVGKIVSDLHLFLASIFGEQIVLQVSACDLAVDIIGLDLSRFHDVKRHFVSRAQYGGENPLSERSLLDGPEAIRDRWARLTGLPFGARAGAVSALLYDKTHEIKYKSPEKVWFHDIWHTVAMERYGISWTEEMTVWRVEMRFRRGALHEMKQEGVFHGIENAFDLEAHLPGLWSYAVGHVDGSVEGLPDGWLRYVIPSSDSNRSRWEVHPDWKVIQQAFQPEVRQVEEEAQSEEPKAAEQQGSVIPLPEVITLPPYIRLRKREVNMSRLIDQIVGCIVTVEAWRARPQSPELKKTFAYIQWRARKRLEEKGDDFALRVSQKQSDYSILRDSDAAA